MKDSVFIEHLGDIGPVDELYSTSRRTLFSCPDWRCGPDRVNFVFSEVMQAFLPFGIENRVFLELGCGIYHPLGVSAAMYLNGVSRAIAFDMRLTVDMRRAAEALYDLLADCALHPSRWHLSSISRDQYMERLYQFDGSALKRGDLQEGIRRTSLHYTVGKVEDSPFMDSTIDLVSSRSVLEHVHSFLPAVSELHRILCDDGVGFHHVDLKDHRIYTDPENYHPWSFMEEGNANIDPSCNLLRYNEIKHLFKRSGFLFSEVKVFCNAIPKDIKSRLNRKYLMMSDDDLITTGVDFVIRKQIT